MLLAIYKDIHLLYVIFFLQYILIDLPTDWISFSSHYLFYNWVNCCLEILFYECFFVSQFPVSVMFSMLISFLGAMLEKKGLV